MLFSFCALIYNNYTQEGSKDEDPVELESEESTQGSLPEDENSPNPADCIPSDPWEPNQEGLQSDEESEEEGSKTPSEII